MIYYFTPYSLEKDIAKAYNSHCALVPNDDDWICLLDGDFAFLTPDWGHDIEEATKSGYDLLTCLTFRTRNKNQQFARRIWPLNDASQLYHLAMQQKQKKGINTIHSDIAGFCMIFKKSLWNEFKFPKGLGVLGVDTEWSYNLVRKGKKVGVINNLVGWHYYRAHKNIEDTTHLK